MPVFDFSSASEEKEAFVCTYTVEDGKKGELVSDGILQVTYSEEEKETVEGESSDLCRLGKGIAPVVDPRKNGSSISRILWSDT